MIAEDNMVILHVRNNNWPHPERGGAVVDVFSVETVRLSNIGMSFRIFLKSPHPSTVCSDTFSAWNPIAANKCHPKKDKNRKQSRSTRLRIENIWLSREPFSAIKPDCEINHHEVATATEAKSLPKSGVYRLPGRAMLTRRCEYRKAPRKG